MEKTPTSTTAPTKTNNNEPAPLAQKFKLQTFTMLEMVIVIMVVGMIFGLAISKLDSVIPESRLKQQVRRTVSLIDLTGAQAATEGRPLALVFDREKRLMRIEFHKDESLEQNVEIFDMTEEDESLYEVEWDKDIELYELRVTDLDGDDNDSDRIVFLPEGSCDGAKLIWKDVTGLKQSLELWPLLSKVSILPIDASEVW
jgi:type II secretory pathway pseudopilin PulG